MIVELVHTKTNEHEKTKTYIIEIKQKVDCGYVDSKNH
ncbi:hypothetical protein C8N46_10311 [Kordia periserrulae]|uniref:Uncharacterized protein n=1 Tax=Kordia periserrulae TaxID=701523 RepID=A0A2T6C0Q5_9FLAO|nr:hypothetical protein C8N46_10311 [Kordia periserrulae]